MADVVFTMTSDEKDVQAALQRLTRGMTKLREENRRLRDESKRGSNESMGALSAQGMKVLQLAGAYLSLGATIGSVVRGLKDMDNAVSATLNRVRDAEAKLQIQAGIGKGDFDKQLPVIRAAIEKTPAADAVEALAIQQQLVSSGFKQEDIDSGRLLSEVLQFRAATGQFDQPGTQQVQAISQFLKAQGKELSSESVRELSQQFTALFKNTDVQLVDLSQIAKASANLTSSGLSQQQQLAALSTVRDIASGEEAATALRNIVTRLSTAGADKRKSAALGELGLKPEDVDLIGEDFPAALNRLAEGVKRVREAGGNVKIPLKQLFEEQGLAFAESLIDRREEFVKRIQVAEESPAFEQNVEIFRSTGAAAQRRTESQRVFAERGIGLRQQDVTTEDVRAAIDAAAAEAIERGEAPIGVEIRRQFLKRDIETQVLTGEEPRQALQNEIIGDTGLAAEASRKINERFAAEEKARQALAPRPEEPPPRLTPAPGTPEGDDFERALLSGDPAARELFVREHERAGTSRDEAVKLLEEILAEVKQQTGQMREGRRASAADASLNRHGE